VHSEEIRAVELADEVGRVDVKAVTHIGVHLSTNEASS
jgi:hypothetical protein